MCGIAGLIHVGGARPKDDLRAIAQAMVGCVRHRGPDAAGSWSDDTSGVALGFRRLAILDLSAAGHQPMTSRDGRLVLMLNGEIYNHATLKAELRTGPSASLGARDGGWAGHSDTEILLACFEAWGVEKTLERAVGMFAIALWDRHARRLFLARDRFGEKPLYYGWTRGAFVFGSELAALRHYPQFDNPIDRDVLGVYMRHSHVPAPYSIYRDVYKLQPGCFLSLSPEDAAGRPPRPLRAPVRHGGLTLERYWSLPNVAQRGLDAPIRDEREAIDNLHAALAAAVRLQSIADVPLGAFLSGGIDSSLIVALMQSELGQRVRTFTIGFHESEFNEAPYAKAVASHLGTDHVELYVSGQQTRDMVPQLPRLYTEPLADASQIPTYLVARIAREHVTVALSGDGGDELFGGYARHYWWPRLWSRLQAVPAWWRHELGDILERVPTARWDALADVLPRTRHITDPGDKAHRLANHLKRADAVDDLYRVMVTAWPPDSGVVTGAEPLWTVLEQASSWGKEAEPEHRFMLWDALTYLPDEVLHKVDRASMAVSLETRAPFLDHRVAELAWRLPLRMKIRDGTGKWILRQLLDRYVPTPLVERPKKGFDVPIEAWLRGPLREWAEDLLSETRLGADGYFNVPAVRSTWIEHLEGRRNWRKRLWTVLMFQAWLAEQNNV